MAKKIFVSLPVADVARSTSFYEAIGCVRDTRFSGAHVSAMTWSEAITFMVMDKAFYATLTKKEIADPAKVSQMLIALSLDDRAAVDAINANAIAAGGREVHGAEDEGYMYSRAFEDLDGHGFGPFTMDVEAAMNAAAQAEPA
jgi:predicted lactoylglutathione lyase